MSPIATIIGRVAFLRGLDPADLTGPRRTRDLAEVRQGAMWIARRLTSASTSEIGQAFGGRDHTTVLHAIQRTEDRRARSALWAAFLAWFEAECREALGVHAATAPAVAALVSAPLADLRRRITALHVADPVACARVLALLGYPPEVSI